VSEQLDHPTDLEMTRGLISYDLTNVTKIIVATK
jgi:hypothetical protein